MLFLTYSSSYLTERMEVTDEMELLFQEIGNETILPGTSSSSFHDPSWLDHHLSPINHSIFMSPAETHWSLDHMNENLLTDTIRSFSDEVDNGNEIGFDSHGFDVPLQQSPPSSWGSPFSNTFLDDSYVASFLETLSPHQMVSHGSPMESLSMNNSYDDFGSLVELLQDPTEMSDLSVFNAFDGNLNSVHTRDCFDGNVNLQTSRDIVANTKTGSWIGDSCSMNVGNGDKPAMGCVKTSKNIMEKTKPGSRTVPKDRMLTYACYAELRELIPNGEKMSIDRLLHRAIKQLHFLQGVAKHAKGLAKHQLLKDRKDQKDNFKNIVSGVTQGCETENEMMICPLVVEDLSTLGQKLIRILCQEQGFFLEIADMIRGFGLNILKGSMKVHEGKIHAEYIVEAEENRFVSRHEIFSSLVYILGLTDPSNEFIGDDLRQGGAGLKNVSVQSTCDPTSLPNRMPSISIL